MASVSPAGLALALGGRNDVPMLVERAGNLNEAGSLLLRSYGGRFLAMVERAGACAPDLAALLASELSSYRDVTLLAGREHRFYKRAQICASDLASALKPRTPWEITDLNLLTAFADYKVPQVLRALGVLEYSLDLARNVDSSVHLAAGSAGEVAIRAATVWAVEHLRRECAAFGKQTTSRQLDWQIWLLGQTPIDGIRPYHLTRTIFY